MSGKEMEALNDAIDGLAAKPVADLDSSSLSSLLLGLETARTRLEAVTAAVLGAFDARGEWAADGSYSAANWLRARTGTARAAAGVRTRMARHLASMPLAAAAFGVAEITESHVRVLARGLASRTRLRFAEHEGELVRSAQRLSADDLAKVMERWLELADPDGAEPRPERPDELHISETLDGRVVGWFSFGRELGVEVLEAIRAKTDELFHRDRRGHEGDPTDRLVNDAPAVRRARAVAELIADGLGAKEPQRRRPTFMIIVRPESGGGTGPFNTETADGSVVPSGLANTWLCDSEVMRLVMSAPGVPLDLGRTVRTANADQRRALLVRDGGCVVPGCDRPPGWCDAHHLVWWKEGGRTDLDNLALICRHHHRRIHTGALTVRMIDGLPRVFLADGRPLVHPRGRPVEPGARDVAA